MRYPRPWADKLRPYAWLSLAAIGVAYLWMLRDVFRYWGAPLWPNENTELTGWLIFVVLTLHIPAPLLGFWLLFGTRRRGGGWLRWRWWVGAGIVAVFLLGLAQQLAANWPTRLVYMAAHPWLGSGLALAAILPLWIVTSPRETE